MIIQNSIPIQSGQNFSLKFKVIKQFINFALLIATLNFALLTFNLDKADASALSLGIYPPIIQVQADPPANIDSPITIQNLGSETVDLDIVFKPFTAKDSENGEIKYLLEKDGVPGANPLIFQKIQLFEGDHAVRNITLAPSEQKKLNFRLKISKDEPISDYYFSIVFLNTPKTPNLPNSPNTQAQGGVAVNVLLSIGKGQAKGVIEEFSSPLFLEKGPVPFTVRVKNTGKHVIAPIGQILIKNFFGQTVGKVDLLPVNILSQTTRAIPSNEQYKFEARNSKLETPQEYLPLRGGANSNNQNTNDKNVSDLENSNFSIVSDFDIRHSNFRSFPEATWPENFLLGPYTATLTLALSDEGPIYKKTINFFGAPTQIFIGLIIAILIVVLVVSKVKRRLG